MSKFGKYSKYKHTVGKEYRREEWYPDVRPSTNTADSCDMLTASRTTLAFPGTGGGGSVIIIPTSRVGKTTVEPVSFACHTAPVSDLKFSPFSDTLLATASEDASVKVWNLPADGTAPTAPAATLSGHGKRVESIAWNPVAANVLATISADKTLRIWNAETGEEKYKYEGFNDGPQCVAWSYDGTRVAVTCKDRAIRVIDPRTNAVLEGPCHEGVKATRVIWLGDSNRILTTGFNKTRGREYMIFNAETMGNPIVTTQLDSSTGVLMPFLDWDTRLFYLIGKGDTTIRFYEVQDSSPWLTDVGTVAASSATEQQIGAAMLPKRAVQVMECEIVRIFKLTRSNIIPVKFEVPRKTHSEYHSDIFPDTRGDTPAVSADQWFAGENGTVALVSMTPAVTRTYAITAEEQAAMAPASPTAAASAGSGAGGRDSPQQPLTAKKWAGGSKWGNAPAEGGEVKRSSWTPGGGAPSGSAAAPGGILAFRPDGTEKAPEPEMRKINVPKVVRTSKYRHIVGKANKKEACFDAIKLNVAICESLIKANRQFFAVPWVGAGGQVAVIPITQFGRCPTDMPTISFGSPCTDFDLSPFVNNLLVTGSEDAHIRVWRFPEEGVKSQITAPTMDLTGHGRKITTLNFHPTVNNVFASTSQDATVRLWDLNAGAERIKIEGFGDQPLGVNFSWTGDRIVTSCKDKQMRIHDARSRDLIASGEAHGGVKPWKAIFLGNTGRILTVGFSKSSERQAMVWDERALNAPLSTVTIDISAGNLLPFYDPDTTVLFLAGKGDATIRTFEVNDQSPCLHPLAPYTATVPQNGVAMLPKQNCNVTEVEFAHMLKITTDKVEPLVFTVPRTRKEFFQDDVYPPTRSWEPSAEADDWFNGTDASPIMVSLRPEGMPLLSDAPEERPAMRTHVKVDTGPEDKRSAKDKLIDSVSSRMSENNELPQDKQEGAAAEEWGN